MAPLFAIAANCWRAHGWLSKVRVEQISDDALLRVWTHPESVFRIVNRFVMDSINSSIEGSLIEVALRSPDADGDWIALTVRDWAGGKPDGWAIDPSTQQLVKQLEGYIDVTNHPGRGSVCALHLPTGSLAGWLCRQPHSAFGYCVSWNPVDFGLAANTQAFAKVDEAIQSSLQPFGSLVPSQENAYLLTSSSAIDARALETSIAIRLPMGLVPEKRLGETPVSVEYFGLMGEFMQRLESAIPTLTCDFASERAMIPSASTLRIDTPHYGASERSKSPNRPSFVKPLETRMRPRRVRSILH